MKKSLFKTVKRSYLFCIGLLSILAISGYFSYALFTVGIEEKTAINIKTGNLYPTLMSNDGNFLGYKVALSPMETKEITLTLQNNNAIVAKFNLYYKGSLGEGVQIQYKETSPNIPPNEEGVTLAPGASQIYELVLTNNTNQSIQIQFGSDVGLEEDDLPLPKDGYFIINRISSLELDDEVEETISETKEIENSNEESLSVVE